ncbi:MAG TPA: hypothetical protein VJT31_18810 [Rugosimonospora sp.]|nr:hypothetical protein [Rugosimonospora sp.]
MVTSLRAGRERGERVMVPSVLVYLARCGGFERGLLSGSLKG